MIFLEASQIGMSNSQLSVTEKYTQDVDCMRSYAALRDRMFFNQTFTVSTPVAQPVPQTTTKIVKQAPPVKDYSTDPTVIIAIQNEPKFINIIMNCRKQKSTLAYIFIEAEYNYITCIIKTPDSFPFMIIRLPINKKYIYARQVENCYEFPLIDIISKDIKFNKSSSYSMVFKYNGKNVQFIYDIYTSTTEPNRVTIDNIGIGSMTVIDNLFSTMLLSTQRASNAMYSIAESPSLTTFDTMSILILKESNSNSSVNFNNKQSSSSNNYFKITKEDHFVYVSETNKKQNEMFICSRDDSLLWALNEVDTEYTMLNFESLFKINYNRSIMQSDRIYYVFASFMNYFMFIKVITSLVITNPSSADTFIKTFSKEYQILESYMCTRKEI